MIMLDGARPDVFDDLVEAGDLPNISRYILQPGGRAPAVTVFPSTTGPAYLPFLTGCYPGTTNIPGIRWLDPSGYGGRWLRDRRFVRSYCGPQGPLFDSDVSSEIASIFDLEPDSAAVCTPFTRGLEAGRVFGCTSRALRGATAHYTKSYEPVDRGVARSLIKLAPRGHRFVFAVFPAIDGLTHSYHPRHTRVLDAYREFDEHLGAYLRTCGDPDPSEHLVALVSDHGAMKVDVHTDIAAALEAWDITTLRHPFKLWGRNPKAAVMVSGNAAAQVYFTPGKRRPYRWNMSQIEGGRVDGIPSDLITKLVESPGVDVLAGVEGEDVVVVSRAGRATLETREDGTIRYRPVTADVLELGDFPQERTADEWLWASFDSPRPDAPVQLTQIFRSHRAGDLILSAAPGFDLREEWEVPEHKSGHGALRADDMRCLVAANHQLEGPLRTADLYPIILEHLGHRSPNPIDGVIRQPVAVLS